MSIMPASDLSFISGMSPFNVIAFEEFILYDEICWQKILLTLELHIRNEKELKFSDKISW